MDLLCCERLQPDLPKTEKDPVIFTDFRVLKNLIYLQKLHMPVSYYFNTIQKDLRPFMRQVVTIWMSEVCEAVNAEDQVFPLAVNILDRFLAVCPVRKRHLQLTAAVCIMMATKVRQCQTVWPDTLCYYADHSFTPEDVKDFELLILMKLQWDLSSVTAYDFVDHLIGRVGLDNEDSLIRQHAVTLVGVCCTETDLFMTLPSVMAAACLVSAAGGLRMRSSATLLESVCALLEGTTVDMVQPIIEKIEEALERQAESVPPNGMETPHKRRNEDSHPETPTDVSDIHF